MRPVRRLLAAMTACVAAFLLAPSFAVACSCAPGEGPPTLRGYDAAANARLTRVEIADPQNGSTHLTYRLTRVFKGSGRFGLAAGETFEIRNNQQESACGLPTREGDRYGLRLDGRRGSLRGQLCSLLSPKQLRKAAERRGDTRPGAARASGCSGPGG